MMTFWIASLCCLPALVVFWGVWIVASMFQPLLVVSVVCGLANPTAARRKLQLVWWTFQYMIMCNDKKWKKEDITKAERENLDRYFAEVETTGTESNESNDSDKTKRKIERKTIIFVRHAVSTWNETFNPGDRPKSSFILYFIPNLLYAIAVEWYFWIMGHANESWFFDSPLSEKGLEQARGLQKFLLQTDTRYSTPKEAAMIQRLRGEFVEEQPVSKNNNVVMDNINNNTSERSQEKNSTTATTKPEPSSQLVCSNLRRAVSTMIIGFQDRLDQQYKNDTILILSCLQEISRNPDALSLTPPESNVIYPSWTDPVKPVSLHQYRNGSDRIDTSRNQGNKPIHSNGYQRIQEFCRIAFDSTFQNKETMIVCGHSLWFKEFFKSFLPHDSDHVAKRKKLVNGGVVGFTLERAAKNDVISTTTATTTSDEKEQEKKETESQEWVYRIDPKSIVVIYGGF